MTTKRFTLPRTGGPPLAFEGRELATGETEPERGPKGRIRQHRLTVYRAFTGQIIAAIVYDTTWPDEHCHHEARVIDPAAPFTAYDPCQGICGYPPGPQFLERQSRLLTWHRQSWAALVSEVLGQIPEACEVLR